LIELHVGGFVRLSTCDWPDELTATIFCQGCSWNCVYCHNQHLLPTKSIKLIAWDDILNFLKSRRGLLDGVVFSGGEPTLQAALPDAIRTIRDMGFRIGLHTAGSYPDRLNTILSLVDWVGLDVKGPFNIYERITGVVGSGDKVSTSLHLLLDSGVANEIRTTVHPELLTKDELLDLMEYLVNVGVKHYAIQQVRVTDSFNELLSKTKYMPFFDLPHHDKRFIKYCVR
jgi:pyruvate formate lyase activating enzyme